MAGGYPSRRGVVALDLSHGRQNAPPNSLPVQAALLKHGIGALGSLQGGVLAVLPDQD